MSEKLDGVRAYWDGKNFISRLGNAFYAPDWFIEGLPETKLDGELWGGRKKFQRTVGIVKRQDKSDAWKEIRYVVFDAPDHEGIFEARLEHLEDVLGDEKAPWASVHPHETVRDLAHVKEELARVEGLGGEGLMMRKPKSKYEIGRSNTLLKVKTFHDAEARVLDHVAGAGRHKGRLGALLVELPNGTKFNVGTGFSDAEREDPPEIGDIITFRYQELSDGGVPRFPSYVGIRHDFAWPGTNGTPAKKPTVSVPVTLDKTLEVPKPAVRPSVPGKTRRFEMTDGETKYFWEILQEGTKHRVQFGTFEIKVKRFETEEEASEELERRIAEKVEKGFTEQEE
jgi:DNA ligase-1